MPVTQPSVSSQPHVQSSGSLSFNSIVSAVPGPPVRQTSPEGKDTLWLPRPLPAKLPEHYSMQVTQPLLLISPCQPALASQRPCWPAPMLSPCQWVDMC